MNHARRLDWRLWLAAAAALITAAMDARRLGMGVGLPQAFLEAAAPVYLTDAEWDALGEHWENVLHEAWSHTAVPCKGVRGLAADRVPVSLGVSGELRRIKGRIA